jgi:Concanavalin A-like lectin/glucanases superfamily
VTATLTRTRNGLYLPRGPVTYRNAVLADAPLAYWRLGETSGTAMADSSGNGHNGTYFAAKTPAAGLLTSDTDGGSNQTSFTPGFAGGWPDTALSSGVSVECWVKIATGGQSNKGIVTRYDSAHCWLVWVDTSGFIAWRAYNTSDAQVNLSWSSPPATLATYYIVGTYVSGMARLYINGTQVASSTTLTGPPQQGGVQSIEIGTYANNTFTADAVKDEVAVYAGELSPTRIAAHYAAR